MSEGVSLIIWPTIAKYSLISLWFYVLCQKLRKCCNGISILKRAYLHNHWFKSYELNSIRKPRRSTLLSFCNAKWDFHTVKHHTATNPKLPNIAMLSKPTVSLMSLLESPECLHALPPHLRQCIWYDMSHCVDSSVCHMHWGQAWWAERVRYSFLFCRCLKTWSAMQCTFEDQMREFRQQLQLPSQR